MCTRTVKRCVCAIGSLLITTAIQAQTTYYVDGSCGDNAWTGASPLCAAPDGPKATIQAAIDATSDGDLVIVADHIYTGSGNRNLDYDGRLITVRSASGPGNCVIDCENSGRGFIFQSGETELAVLDGFTIRNGYSGPGSLGGGIICDVSEPTIRNCTLMFNAADTGGGGMAIHCSEPTLVNCSFVGNSAAIGDGGGIWCVCSAPMLIDCTFSVNSAGGDGGGVFIGECPSYPAVIGCSFTSNTAELGGGLYIANSNTTVSQTTFTANIADGGGGMANFNVGDLNLTDCTFKSNVAQSSFGGGMWSANSTLKFTNCAFTDNTASGQAGHGGGVSSTNCILTAANSVFARNATSGNGGGMYNEGIEMLATVTNCTFVDNTAACCGGGGAMAQFFGCVAIVANSVMWDDTLPEIVDVAESQTIVSYSDIKIGWVGPGNINIDPMFADQSNGSYRLAAGSPCIDAGDNSAVIFGMTTDMDGGSRFVDDPNTKDTGVGDPPIVDMGAYEFQPIPCVWDLDGNGFVGSADLLVLLLTWGPAENHPADFNGDGMVGSADLLALLVNWGPCP